MGIWTDWTRNEQYVLLAWACAITFGAVLIGWWIKRKFHIGG
jgi:hypothetical protein